MIDVAVVGLGKMGLSHLSIINALPEFKVAAICDTSALVGGVIEKYGSLRYYSDYDEVIARPDLQAVIIATPTRAHEPMVQAAFDRGLHVFCEKPLSLSADASDRLAAIARSKGLVAQVGYHNRFVGTFAEVGRLLAAGAVGRVSHVLAEAYGPVVLKPSKATWRSQAGEGGGCLYDYAAHPLNLLNWYFGRPSGVGGAVLKSGFSKQVDDEVYATLGFDGGVTGQVSVNWSDASVRKMTTRVTVWGERGKIYVDRQELQAFFNPGATPPAGYESGWNVKYITELTPPVSFYLRGEEYSAQLESFGQSILCGEGAQENDFAGSADTDATIEMIRAAALSGDRAASTARASRRSAGLIARVLGR